MRYAYLVSDGSVEEAKLFCIEAVEGSILTKLEELLS